MIHCSPQGMETLWGQWSVELHWLSPSTRDKCWGEPLLGRQSGGTQNTKWSCLPQTADVLIVNLRFWTSEIKEQENSNETAEAQSSEMLNTHDLSSSLSLLSVLQNDWEAPDMPGTCCARSCIVQSSSRQKGGMGKRWVKWFVLGHVEDQWHSWDKNPYLVTTEPVSPSQCHQTHDFYIL